MSTRVSQILNAIHADARAALEEIEATRQAAMTTAAHRLERRRRRLFEARMSLDAQLRELAQMAAQEGVMGDLPDISAIMHAALEAEP